MSASNTFNIIIYVLSSVYGNFAVNFVYIVPCDSLNKVMTFIDLARLMFKCCNVDSTIHWISHYTPDEFKEN